MNIDNNEKDRWLIDGDCKLCRRQKYCNKPCTIRKRKYEQAVRNLVMKYLKSDQTEEEVTEDGESN